VSKYAIIDTLAPCYIAHKSTLLYPCSHVSAASVRSGSTNPVPLAWEDSDRWYVSELIINPPPRASDWWVL